MDCMSIGACCESIRRYGYPLGGELMPLMSHVVPDFGRELQEGSLTRRYLD